MRKCRLTLLSVALATPLLPIGGASPASAHRSGCHSHHSCPSDRATYRWHGQLCKSSSNGGNSHYGRQVRYGGRTYYCHR